MNPPPDNPLVFSFLIGAESRRTPISLWDMIQFLPGIYCCLLDYLKGLDKADEIRHWRDHEWEIKQLIKVIEALVEHTPSWEIPKDRCAGLKNYLEQYIEPAPDADILVQARFQVAPPFSPEVVSSYVQGILETVDKELRQQKFTYIPLDKAQFFEHDKLLGDAVHDRFKDARADIKEAGNCLAADLNTAAVFHLMRVAERGLRALARHLRIKKVKSKVPLDFATWEEIIQAIERETTRLATTKTRGPKRQTDLDFYNDLLAELRQFKDYWRNKVMHTRASYDEHQATSAFNHVQKFMQTLATRLS